MHNDLAWAVLGVDPVTQKIIGDLAQRQGVSIGRRLELLIEQARAAAAEQSSVNESFRKRDRQLRELLADMADCLTAAADLLDKGKNPTTREANTSTSKTEAANVGTAAAADEHNPNIQKIQEWLQRAKDKESEEAPAKRVPGFLRRSG